MLDGTGGLIAIIAVVGGLTIPVVALVADYRRRKLQFAERRLMIERGMVPPPLQDMDEQPDLRSAVEKRDSKLHSGLVCLFVGVGLGVGTYVLTVLPVTFIPRGLAGPMAIGAAVVGALGLAQLAYYAATRGRGGVA